MDRANGRRRVLNCKIYQETFVVRRILYHHIVFSYNIVTVAVNKNKNNDFIDTNVMETYVRKIRRSKLNASMEARNKNTRVQNKIYNAATRERNGNKNASECHR